MGEIGWWGCVNVEESWKESLVCNGGNQRERGNSKGKAKNEVNGRWAFIAG